MNRITFLSSIFLLLVMHTGIFSQRKMETLGRGLVAMRTDADHVFLSWRLLGTEPEDITFNLYRDTSLVVSTSATNYIDTAKVNGNYYIRAVLGGKEQAASKMTGVQTKKYFSIPLQQDIGNYYVHFAWVGDLDGDGEYDFIVDRQGGGSAKLEAYRRDGTFLWRYDCGPNGLNKDNFAQGASAISVGHADDVTVYDLDSDGRAEVIVKSANGVIFGDGTTLVHNNDNEQFISVLDGATGAEEARAPVPQDYISVGPVQGHFGIMYCDGVNPSFIFKAKNRRSDGGFNLMVVAYDYIDGELGIRWKWNRSGVNAPDFHQIRIMDIDGDGRDELCDGGYVLDDDGTYLYAIPGVIHGDRFHITDFDPDRPGLEGYCIQQNNASGLAWAYYDAKDGTIIRQQVLGNITDYGRGTAGDVDPRHKGLEFWTFTDGMYTAQSSAPVISNFPWPNFKIWWDGDIFAELLNSENVSKWDFNTGSERRLLSAGNYGATDSWRDAAQFHGDIMGDWREEVIFGSLDNSEIKIFTTTNLSDTRLYTLPHNPGYRNCMTTKGYQQSHLVDYYLGDSMDVPPTPNITMVVDSAPGSITLPPFRPQNITATTNSDTVELAWAAIPDTSLSGYNIYRTEVSGGNYLKINDSLLSEIFFQDSVVEFEVTYYYAVTAVISDTNESHYSEEIAVKPSQYPNPPGGIIVNDVVDSVELSWDKNKEVNIVGFNVYRSRTRGQSYAKINVEIIENMSFVDKDVENGEIYYYVLTSLNDLELESSYSAEIVAMPGDKVILQAEDAFLQNSSYDSNHDGFYGTGFVNFPSSGGYAEFRNVSGGNNGGDYTLRYRHALDNNDRSGILEVNGISKNITMVGTGDWTNWISTDIGITLIAGSGNVIKFESNGQDFGNLDQIMLLPYKTINPEDTTDKDPVNAISEMMRKEGSVYNFPNPFYSETYFRYNLPQTAHVSLRVFDILGHTVSELVNENQQAGVHEVVWDGNDASGKPVKKGIYFYEMVAGKNRIMNKMILLR